MDRYFQATQPNLLPRLGEAYFIPELFSDQKSRWYLDYLRSAVPWKQEPIHLFGKWVMQPRLTAWYADRGITYGYSGITMHGCEWSRELMEIKCRVEQVSGTTFNSALLNLYRDGNDSMGWHRDNEKALGERPVIASVSFGVERRFQMREYAGKKDLKNFSLPAGSCLIMMGECQAYWEHRVPKDRAIREPRVNITFRRVVN